MLYVDISYVSSIELKRLVGAIPMTEMDGLSLVQKYKEHISGVLAVTSALVGRIMYKTARIIGKAVMPEVKKLRTLKSKLWM